MKLKYCPECGARLARQNRTDYRCSKSHVYYNNPRAAADVFVVEDGRVLLGTRAIDPGRGRLDSIGGFVNYDETSEEAAVREFKEETGLNVELGPIIGTHRHFYLENISTIGVGYSGRLVGGQAQAGDDIASLEWVSLDSIDPERLAFDWLAEFLMRVRKGYGL